MTLDAPSKHPRMHQAAAQTPSAVTEPPGEPEQPRRPGRSRAYTAANLPERLRQWHSPRINRRERLWVTGDSLAIE